MTHEKTVYWLSVIETDGLVDERRGCGWSGGL